MISAHMKKTDSAIRTPKEASSAVANVQNPSCESSPHATRDSCVSAFAGQQHDLAHHLETIVPLEAAAKFFGFSRTSFFRFRRRHRLRKLPGNKVSMSAIVISLESERTKDPCLHARLDASRSLPEVLRYRENLLSLSEAAARLNCSSTTFWRFRVRMRLKLVSGRKIHSDDLCAALERLSLCSETLDQRQR